MVTKYQKFADGYKAEAVKLYRESNQTIAETARNLGLKESTLANWVKKDKDNEAVAVGEAPLTPAERTRIRELEADVRRLNMENAFLKKGVPRTLEAAWRVIRNSPARAFTDLHLIVSKVLISARRA